MKLTLEEIKKLLLNELDGWTEIKREQIGQIRDIYVDLRVHKYGIFEHNNKYFKLYWEESLFSPPYSKFTNRYHQLYVDIQTGILKRYYFDSLQLILVDKKPLYVWVEIE